MAGRPRKVSDANVLRIRRWYAELKAFPLAKDLAREMGISTSRLYQIGKGMQYKTVGRVLLNGLGLGMLLDEAPGRRHEHRILRLEARRC